MNTTLAPAARNAGCFLKLSACALAVSAILSGAALAQDAGPVDDEIRVTGTRIQRSAVETPVPVTRVNADELDKMTPGTLIEALTALPQFYDNIATRSDHRRPDRRRSQSQPARRRRQPEPYSARGKARRSEQPLWHRRRQRVSGGAGQPRRDRDRRRIRELRNGCRFRRRQFHSRHRLFGIQAAFPSWQHRERRRRELRDRRRVRHRHRRTNAHHWLARNYSSDAIDTFDALQDRGFYRQSARVTNPTAGGPAGSSVPT